MNKATPGNVYVEWEIADRLLDQLDQVAEQLKITRDEAVRSALSEYLALRKRPPITGKHRTPKG
jgi:metal-responsive CopG/Arc/MetJ family transcriptional regulator